MPNAQKSRSNSVRSRARPIARLELPVRSVEAKTQLNTRVSEANYRQLKLAALLRGVTVQTLVAHALEEFLTNHPELLQTSPATTQQRSKPPVRRPRSSAR